MHSSTKNAEGGELGAGEWGWGAGEFGSGARGEELGEGTGVGGIKTEW